MGIIWVEIKKTCIQVFTYEEFKGIREEAEEIHVKVSGVCESYGYFNVLLQLQIHESSSFMDLYAIGLSGFFSFFKN